MTEPDLDTIARQATGDLADLLALDPNRVAEEFRHIEIGEAPLVARPHWILVGKTTGLSFSWDEDSRVATLRHPHAWTPDVTDALRSPSRGPGSP